MKDRLNNELVPGRKVFWTVPGVIATVIGVEGEKLKISVEFQAPAEASLRDFICVADPMQEVPRQDHPANGKSTFKQ